MVDKKKPSYTLEPYKHYEDMMLPKYKITMTTSAEKVISQEEAKMLVNMLSHEFSERPHLNSFHFEKVGLWVLKDKNHLTIITEEDKKSFEAKKN